MSDIGTVSRRRRLRLITGVSLMALATSAAHAQNATWLVNPTSGDFNTPANWAPPVVPTDTAFFGPSAITNLSFSANTNVNGWTFNPDASAYSFTNGVTLQFFGAGIVINGGSATITNLNQLFFQNASSAGSATIINTGFTDFFGQSTAGNAIIVTNAGGRTEFFNNSTGGQARLITNAGGVVDFSGSTGPAGDGNLSAGSIEGAGSYYLGPQQVTVGGNNLSTTVTGVISDCGPTGAECSAGGVFGGGELIKAGAGTLTLAGINTYTGGTTVNGGTLLVNGSIASSVFTSVNAGATLAGAGTVGTVGVNAGGTFAPGPQNAPGSMTVAGDLIFQPGAFYLVQVAPAGASIANVTGTATLAGLVQAYLQPGAGLNRSYTILHANGGLGGTQFAGVTTNAPGFNATLSYTANDVILNLNAALGQSTLLNVNQRNVATAINGFFNNGGLLPPGFVPLFGLTGAQLANALTLLSGEVATGAQQSGFRLMDMFLSVMLDPFVDGRSGSGWPIPEGGRAISLASEETLPPEIALAYAKALKAPPAVFLPDRKWSVWGSAYGGASRTSGDPVVIGSHDLSARAGGFAAGLDYRMTPDTVVGFALAGGFTDWKLAAGLGSGESDAIQAGVYGVTRNGPAYFAGALAYTNHWMRTDRFSFASDHLTASFDAQSFGGRLEGGWRFGTVIGGITPYSALQVQSFHTPFYNESDLTGGGFGLAYNARTATDTRSELGVRFDQMVPVGAGAVVALRARAAWAHDWVTEPTAFAGFQALPGAFFIVNGASPAEDSALVTSGAELRLANGLALGARFEGEFASESQTYAGFGTVRYAW